MSERAVVIDCENGPIVAVIHRPDQPALGVTPLILVVGGPQTRVGSHRQFVLLARALCDRGIPVLRFDYQGMGDSPGEQSSFLEAVPSLKNVVNYFANEMGSDSVAFWGLCDAVSLIFLYLDMTQDSRVSHIIALNPWVRQTKSEAQVMLRHYYLRRLVSPGFWKRVFKFDLNIGASVKDLVINLQKAFGKNAEGQSRGSSSEVRKIYTEENYVEAMRTGLSGFRGKLSLVLSGNDLTADEFRMLLSQDNNWNEIVNERLVSKLEIDDANHTFSSERWRQQVELFSINCLLG